VREWADYQHRILASQAVQEAEEQLDADQLRLEELYLGLRTIDGLRSDLLPDATRMAWAAAGWAREADGRTRLTAEGWLRLDALVQAAA
jgi:coproporphyrinogen III oxidase-like Fe-S oxidoreductase